MNLADQDVDYTIMLVGRNATSARWEGTLVRNPPPRLAKFTKTKVHLVPTIPILFHCIVLILLEHCVLFYRPNAVRKGQPQILLSLNIMNTYI